MYICSEHGSACTIGTWCDICLVFSFACCSIFFSRPRHRSVKAIHLVSQILIVGSAAYEDTWDVIVAYTCAENKTVSLRYVLIQQYNK